MSLNDAINNLEKLLSGLTLGDIDRKKRFASKHGVSARGN